MNIYISKSKKTSKKAYLPVLRHLRKYLEGHSIFKCPENITPIAYTKFEDNNLYDLVTLDPIIDLMIVLSPSMQSIMIPNHGLRSNVGMGQAKEVEKALEKGVPVLYLGYGYNFIPVTGVKFYDDVDFSLNAAKLCMNSKSLFHEFELFLYTIHGLGDNLESALFEYLNEIGSKEQSEREPYISSRSNIEKVKEMVMDDFYKSKKLLISL